MSRLDELYSEEWRNKLFNRVRVKFGQFPEWEEYYEFAISELGLRLERYSEAEISKDSLIYTIFDNIVIDQHRKIYGNQRPRVWLQRQPYGVEIYDYKCKKGLSNEAIMTVFRQKFSDDGNTELDSDLQLEQIQWVLDEIDRIDDCNYGRRMHVSLDEGTGTVDNIELSAFSTDEEISESEVTGLMSFLMDGDMGGESTAAFQKLLTEIKTVVLSDEQLLVLRLYYESRKTDAKGALLLNMQAHQFRTIRLNAIAALSAALSGKNNLSD